MGDRFDYIFELKKFNPYHDDRGRFATANRYSSFTIRKKDPGKQHWADLAIAREKDKYNNGRQNYLPETKKPKNKKPKEQKPKEQKPKQTTNKPQGETKTSDFTPAKTKKEAVKYAQEKLGFEKVSYGTKIDLETINHINKQITDIQAKYPEVKGAVQELKTARGKNSYAYVSTDFQGRMELNIGTNIYGRGVQELEKMYERDAKAGFHVPGTTAGSIIWHEYGHVLGGISTKKKHGLAANRTFSSSADDVDRKLNFIKDKKAKVMERQWLSAAAKELGMSESEVSQKISRYATKNAAEAFAEAFAEVTGSKNPRKEALAVVKASGWYRE